MKDLTLYNHINSSLQCISCYDADINVIDSYDEKQTPFLTLWVGNETRHGTADEGLVRRAYDCKSAFSIIYVGKLKRRQNGADEKTIELDEIKDKIEFCINKVSREKQFTIYDTLATTEKQMEIYLEDIVVNDIYKTYPVLDNQNISILFEGEIYYKQINYIN